MKKRIIIVDCNAKIGGIQKALIALLKQIYTIYDVTLLLLNKEGPLLKEIPEGVRVISTKSDFRYMGMAQADCKKRGDKIRRAIYVLLCKCLGQKRAVMLASLNLYKDNHEEYDAAISYSHMAGDKAFFGGTAQYVLKAIKAKRKICYIHCDYLNSGNRSKYSDQVYSKFDSIVCVSETVKKRFVEALPAMEDCTYAIYNPIDEASIIQQAYKNTVKYDRAYINIVSIARLSEEKGIGRFIEILSRVDQSVFRYYVVGDGIERMHLENRVKELELEQVVTFCGEESNPYRYMLEADLLVVPSLHEAAPVVFQEAKIIGLPVLTTRTTSAEEMIGTNYGFVVDNSDDALLEAIVKIQNNMAVVKEYRNRIKGYHCDDLNNDSIEKLLRVFNGTI